MKKKYIHVLTIAGSDCSGGAGIQADIKTISALGGYASSVITAVTVQNTCSVSAVYPIPADIVRAQLEAVLTDMPPAIIKIGMLNDAAVIHTLAETLRAWPHIPVVLDPIILSSSGYPLLHEEALQALKEELFPRVYLLTPNLPEATWLTGEAADNEEGLIQAAASLHRMGCRNILIKGGHRHDREMKDFLAQYSPNPSYHLFSEQKIESSNTHGTGCTLSSAIATALARRMSLPEAISFAKKYLTQAIEAGKDCELGQGTGPLNHFFNPEKSIFLPPKKTE